MLLWALIGRPSKIPQHIRHLKLQFVKFLLSSLSALTQTYLAGLLLSEFVDSYT